MAFKSFQSGLCLSSWCQMHSPFLHTIHQPWRFCCSLNTVYSFFTMILYMVWLVFGMPFFFLCLTFCNTAKNSPLPWPIIIIFFLSVSLSILFMYNVVCYEIIEIIMWFPKFDPFFSLPQKRHSKGVNYFLWWFWYLIQYIFLEWMYKACLCIHYHTT